MKLIIRKNQFRTTPGPTVFIQNPKTGLMVGRKDTEGRGDSTRNIRFTQDIDVNRDGKIDHRDIRRGQVGGRVGAGQKVPNSLELTKVREHRRGKVVVSNHFRKVYR